MQSDNKYSSLKQYLFSLSTPHFQWPDGPIYDDKGQAKSFNLQNLLRFLNNGAVNQLQTALTRWLKRIEPKLVCINYQLGKTRIAAVHKVTLFAVRIKPTKVVISFLINIKPIQSRKTSKNVIVHLTAQ